MFGGGTHGFERECVGFTIFPFWPYWDLDLSFTINLDDIPGGGYGIEGTWFTGVGEPPMTTTMTIAPIPDPTVGTWYRLRAAFTKLTDTSLSIDAQVWQLDAAGEKVSLFASGSIADTSTLENGPSASFFTDGLWPVYRNYQAYGGGCDNAYFGFIPAEQ